MELLFWPDLVSLLKKLNGRMLLVVLVISLLIIDLVKKRRPRNFPPGPQLFPLVGTFVDFKQPLHLALQKLTGRYGNIFSVQFGSLTFVVVNGYQMVREALVHQAEIFADRPNIPLLQEIFKGFGLISSNGHIWRQQRKFALATLKSLAVNFEEKVQEESRYLVETIEEEKGQPFDPHYKINSAVSNIICSITFGNRFDYHDNRFQELLHSLAETLLLIGSFWGQLYNAFPLIMRWLPGPFRKIFRHWEKLQYFVKGVIAKHKEDLDQSEAGDYIDCYLKEIEKFKGDTTSYFHEENLLCSTLDLFLTGTETTATAIRWALLYMAAYPHIQEKVQQEIDAVVGQCRQPSMADKEKMPYTSAVLSEVLRVGNVVPLGVPRMATSDTTLAGFHLPKGTTLMTSLTSIMFDKNVWETPDTFNPGHFLENGQYRRREAFLPFSAGKRACPGEQLARTELFIFFVALLQKFTFQAPAAAALSFAFTLSLTRCPKPFRLRAVPRG
ncbi:cytochrome P450 2J2-like [Catharus ustulatus]|nr:cytochrome P450 2J2-like [Catharus ustulatus]